MTDRRQNPSWSKIPGEGLQKRPTHRQDRIGGDLAPLMENI